MVTLNQTADPLTCPVRAVRWALAANASAAATAPLLVFADSLRSIPTSHLRTVWSATLKAVGGDPRMHSLHSLRKASATTVYDAGCTELEVQRHGGWASTAYRTYIRTDAQKKISKALSDSRDNKTLLISFFLPPIPYSKFIPHAGMATYFYILYTYHSLNLYIFISSSSNTNLINILLNNLINLSINKYLLATPALLFIPSYSTMCSPMVKASLCRICRFIGDTWWILQI